MSWLPKSPKARRRLWIVAAAAPVLALAVGLSLWAMKDNVTYFFSPSEVTEAAAPTGRVIRLGGLVEMGSVHKGSDGTVVFVITDNVDFFHDHVVQLVADFLKGISNLFHGFAQKPQFGKKSFVKFHSKSPFLNLTHSCFNSNESKAFFPVLANSNESTFRNSEEAESMVLMRLSGLPVLD